MPIKKLKRVPVDLSPARFNQLQAICDDAAIPRTTFLRAIVTKTLSDNEEVNKIVKYVQETQLRNNDWADPDNG